MGNCGINVGLVVPAAPVDEVLLLVPCEDVTVVVVTMGGSSGLRSSNGVVVMLGETLVTCGTPVLVLVPLVVTVVVGGAVLPMTLPHVCEDHKHLFLVSSHCVPSVHLRMYVTLLFSAHDT